MDAISKSLLVEVGPNGKQGFRRGAIVFTNGGGIADGLIRIGQGFRGYTHCGIALGNGKMIASFAPAGGVVMQDDLQQLRATEARMGASMYPSGVEAMIQRAGAKVGRAGYDWGALFGAVGLPAWGVGPPNAFTCSSLIACCAVFPEVPTRFLTPQDLWVRLNG